MAELKPGWQRVKFGDVVRLNKETCKDPEAEGIERVIGLEHLEPGDLRIRSWGDVADGSTFTKRVRPGQVLFGKRRAYQRKVAVAHFDAICSGDIYVFESSDSTCLLPGLVPYICQTNGFLQHAVGTSAGSLSPRTNWKSLATYEFALPSPKEQRRLLRVLNAAQNASNCSYLAFKEARNLFRATHEKPLAKGSYGGKSKIIGGIPYAINWPIVPLGQIASVERGRFSHRPRNLPEFFGGEYPFVQVGDIAASCGLLGQASQYLSEAGVKYSRSFPPGTVLISITGVVIGHAAVTTRELWTTDSIVGIQPCQSVLPEFVELVLRRLQPLLNNSLSTFSTTQKNINLEILKPLPMPLPEMSTQARIVALLGDIQESVMAAEKKVEQSRNFVTRLADAVLCGGDF